METSTADTTTTQTEPSETFQIPLEIAESYEALFVPAFFAQWAGILCDAAGVTKGQRVLDVACGTGIVTRTAADRSGPEGHVTGVDLNESMLVVARRVRPEIDWRQGPAEDLPVGDCSYDTVLSQMAMMFFEDRARAVAEMARAAVVGGTVAVLVPATIGEQVAFGPFAEMVVSHAGASSRKLLESYFSCGDPDRVSELFTQAGLDVTHAGVATGTYRAPSVEGFVATEVQSTPLGQQLTDETYRAVEADAKHVLAPYVTATGAVEAPFDSIVVVGRRR